MPPALSRATREWLSLLGAEVRAARLQQGIALADVASRIGVTRQTVAALESGAPTVAIGTVFEAAAVLQMQLLRTDQDSVRERLAQTRQLIDLLPRGQSHKEAVTNADDVPEYF
jgi:transcriptional regulator with XRE-family HTH domain